MYLLSNDTKLLIPAFVSFRGFEDKYRRPTVFCVHPGVSNMAAPSRYVLLCPLELVLPTFEQFLTLRCGMAIVSWG